MDPRDAIREARLRLKKLAATAEARAEKLREERTQLERQLARLEAEHREWSARGRPEAEEASRLIDELRARNAAIELELGTAIRQREEALREGDEVKRLVPELERAEVQRIARSVQSPAIDERSPADIALENVRHHLDQLEAEAALGAELSARSAPPPESKPDPRAQLEALKAARKREASPTVPDEAEAESSPPASPPKSKRTM